MGIHLKHNQKTPQASAFLAKLIVEMITERLEIISLLQCLDSVLLWLDLSIASYQKVYVIFG